jgi:hypothetical protein
VALVLPVVRYLIPCEDYLVDPAHPNKISLINLIVAIRSLEQPPFPALREEFCVFLMLSNGRGSGRLSLSIVQADTDEVILKTSERTMAFSNNPLDVVGLPIRFKDCGFPAAGLYWIQVWFDDQLIGEQDLLLK